MIIEEFRVYAGWETLLLFVRNSIFNGSKEVALAAVNCLQSTIVSHSPKVVMCTVFMQIIFLHSNKMKATEVISLMNITKYLLVLTSFY